MRIQNGYSYFLMAHPLNISTVNDLTCVALYRPSSCTWSQIRMNTVFVFRLPLYSGPGPPFQTETLFLLPRLAFIFLLCLWLLFPILASVATSFLPTQTHTHTHTLPRMSCGRSYYQDIDRH